MIVLELAGVKPLTANDVRRANQWQHRKAVADLKALLDAAYLVGPRPRLDEPVIATLEVRPPTRQHRDVDGWAPTLKAALDVAVARGALPDDCACHVPEVRVRALPPGKPWLIRLLFHPIRLTASELYGVTA